MNIPKNTCPPPTEIQLEQLKGFDVCSVCHVLVDLGYYNTFFRGIAPLSFPDGQESFIGLARTLRFLPLREDLVKAQYADNLRSPHRTALESIEPGEVLVIDTGGCMESGVVGDIFTRRVKYRGGQAIVIDGVLRDLGAIRETDFPVYAKGVHGSGINRFQMSAGVNEPVQCGGVAVVPGDVIFGDKYGVIAIPPHMVEAVIAHMQGKGEMEEWIRRKIRSGGDLHHYYQHPPIPEVVQEYERERQAGAFAHANGSPA